MPEENTVDKISDAATRFVETLTEESYTLTEKVAVCRVIRRILRQETEEEQKQLQSLLDSL